MLSIAAPHGPIIQIPTHADEDDATYPGGNDAACLRAFYEEHGYVVMRSCVSSDLCEQARGAFEAEVKPHDGFLYRQASANPERHARTAHGYMLNSLLNVHAVDPRKFPRFRRASTDAITCPALQAAITTLLGERGTLVQSMYFEGNPSTWAHQDTYYLDSKHLGRMTAAWIALEDIAPGAGRFFVYPGSHKLEFPMNRGHLSIASHHRAYKELILESVRKHGLACRAPALRKGDVLFWNARTIHGSLETTQPQYSRSSMTAHYIPNSTPFVQYQLRRKRLRVSTVNGMRLHTPKDLRHLHSRVILMIEATFPRAFTAAKRMAVRLITR